MFVHVDQRHSYNHTRMLTNRGKIIVNSKQSDETEREHICDNQHGLLLYLNINLQGKLLQRFNN